MLTEVQYVMHVLFSKGTSHMKCLSDQIMFAIIPKIFSHGTYKIRNQLLTWAASEVVADTTMVYFMVYASVSVFINWATVDLF